MGDRIGGQQQFSAILKMFPCPRQQSMGKAELAVPFPEFLSQNKKGLELRSPGVWSTGLFLTLVKPFMFTQLFPWLRS